ncbi:hypothetical protein AI29_05860 [bacteria symbiont BFo2 of Frankliniella occidentalis]|nr:hypothetical protein AI29_05860 [bacteria symbiont BFo2 of Frankliniella occidentalis]
MTNAISTWIKIEWRILERVCVIAAALFNVTEKLMFQLSNYWAKSYIPAAMAFYAIATAGSWFTAPI